MMNQSKRIPDKLLLIFFAVGLLIVLVNVLVSEQLGVYGIAKKIGISKGGKNGSYSDYIFINKHDTVNYSILDHGGGAKYICVKFLPLFPKWANAYTAYKVPSCLQADSNVGKVWKKWDDVPICK